MPQIKVQKQPKNQQKCNEIKTCSWMIKDQDGNIGGIENSKTAVRSLIRMELLKHYGRYTLCKSNNVIHSAMKVKI